MADMHPVEHLWNRLDEIIPSGSWPTGSVPVPRGLRLVGLGCFPCGYGLWEKTAGQPPPPMLARAVMLIGNNWGNTKSARSASLRGSEDRDYRGYWGTIRPLLEGAGLTMKDCFATNAYPGLLTGRSNVGRFPGGADVRFQAACRAFMAEQICVVRPALIVTWGLYVPPFLAPLSGDLMVRGWRNASKLTDLNKTNAMVSRAAFPGAAHVATVVALTHPAYPFRDRNVKHRQYRGLTGDPAEREMLKDAVSAAGL